MEQKDLPPPETWADLMQGYADGLDRNKTIQEVKDALLAWVLVNGKQSVFVKDTLNNDQLDCLWGEFDSGYKYPLVDEYSVGEAPKSRWMMLTETGEKFFNKLEEQ